MQFIIICAHFTQIGVLFLIFLGFSRIRCPKLIALSISTGSSERSCSRKSSLLRDICLVPSRDIDSRCLGKSREEETQSWISCTAGWTQRCSMCMPGSMLSYRHLSPTARTTRYRHPPRRVAPSFRARAPHSLFCR